MSSILLAATNAYISYTQGLLMTYYSHSQSSHPINQSQMNSLFNGATQLGSRAINETIHFSLNAGKGDDWNGNKAGGQGPTKPKPSGWPSDHYAVKFEGFIYAPTTGTYAFGVDADDAADVVVNNTLVADFYGAHGFYDTYTGAPGQVSSTIFLTGGQYYPFTARVEEVALGDGISVGWKKPGDSNYSLIPATNFFYI